MKRYFDFQSMDWSDKLMMRMEEMRWDACLALFPQREPGDGVIETAESQELMVLCQQHWQNVPFKTDSKTLRKSARQAVVQNLERDADTLSVKERTLLEKILISGGKSALESSVEMEAALTMRMRLWADVGIADGEPWVALDSSLIEPLSAALMRTEHFERRMRIFTFDAMVNGLLYITGFLEAEVLVQRFIAQVLGEEDSWEARRRARCFMEASYDCVTVSGGMLLVHEGLAAPEKLIRKMSRSGAQPPEVTPEAMMGSLNGLLPEEAASSERLSLSMQGAMRPEYNTMEATLALRLLTKQGAPFEALKDALMTMLCVMPTRHMLDSLKEMYRSTPRWDCPGLEKMAGPEILSSRSAPGAALLN